MDDFPRAVHGGIQAEWFPRLIRRERFSLFQLDGVDAAHHFPSGKEGGEERGAAPSDAKRKRIALPSVGKLECLIAEPFPVR